MGLDINRAREWVNQNSAAVTIGAVIILIFSLAYLWFSNPSAGPGSRAVMDAYFYDVESNETFTARADELPPIQRENGHKAYKSYIFTCSECSNEADRFVGYYEGFTADYKEKRQKAIDAAKSGGTHPMPDEAMYMEEGYSKGRMISRDGKEWVTSDSPQGIAINMDLSKACEGKGTGRLKPCYPGMK
jgi:hypothetical protein